jgi:hypothetical protein
MALSLMNRLDLCQVYIRIAHIACYWKVIRLHYKKILSQATLCKADRTYLTYLQRQSYHLNSHKLDRRQVQASYISCLASPCSIPRAYTFSYFCRAYACCLHNFIIQSCNTEGWNTCANRRPMGTLENFQWWGQICFVGAAILDCR